MGGDRIESLWHEYSQSPILTHFNWSPLVKSGVDRNLHLFSNSTSSLSTPQASRNTPLHNSPSSPPSSYIPGLVTMHVRRGDFKSRESLFTPLLTTFKVQSICMFTHSRVWYIYRLRVVSTLCRVQRLEQTLLPSRPMASTMVHTYRTR